MKYPYLLPILLILLGAGCQQPPSPSPEEIPKQQREKPVVLENPQLESVIQNEPIIEKPVAKQLYKGYWFDIEYPETFTARPLEPINYHEGVRMILTDQAYFTSPDGEVEFYVYSPLWAGYPEYLDMLSTEELVSEEVVERDTTPPNAELKKKNRVTFKTYKEKKGLYFRSIALYENNIYEGEDLPETTHLFGVRYSSQESYSEYKQIYIDFKQSLNQYSD